MQEIQHDSWGDNVVHATVQKSDAPQIRFTRQRCTLTVTVGNTDLPAFLSDGVLYIQAPLGLFFEAFAENISDFVRDMEIRVSNSRGAPLPLDGDGRPVPRSRMAQSRVVRRGEKR